MWKTLDEIASKAGVSPATASRVLNGKAGVRPQTRDKVLAAMNELQYTPNMTARGLVTSRTMTVGYVSFQKNYTADVDPFYPHITHGIEAELQKHGYHLLVTTISAEQVRDAATFKLIAERRVDGLIILPHAPQRFVLQLKQMRVPVVLVDSRLGTLPVDYVQADNLQGGQLATQHLIEHGHKHIVALLGPQEWASSFERGQGYTGAMASSSLTPRILRASETTVSTGAELAEKALAEVPELTAIFAANDSMAIGAMGVLAERERRVPEEVAVMGFDDIAWAKHSQPQLSTVKVFTNQMGRLAARRVLDLIEDDEAPPAQIRIATELVLRQSCGCRGGEVRTLGSHSTAPDGQGKEI